jgi:L-iditol 2-dehydrogenase
VARDTLIQDLQDFVPSGRKRGATKPIATVLTDLKGWSKMIPDMMKASYVKAPDLVELRDVPVPKPGPNEVLVKVGACGVCGTDAHIAFHLAADWQPLGHEVGGTVVKVGPGVSRVSEGDRVTLECSTPCFMCFECRRGYPGRCPNAVGFYGQQSGYAEYIRVHEHIVVPIGEMDFTTAALIEPFTVALGTVDRIEPNPDDTVLVIGPGPIGLMALAACRLMGVRHAILAGRAHSVARLRMGKALGADRVVRVDEEDLQAVIVSEFQDGVDKVIITGHPQTVVTAIELINRHGIISYIGLTDEDCTPLTFDAHTFHFKALQLRPFGGYASPFFHRAIDLLRRGVPPVDRFVSHVFPLEQLDRALHAAAEDKEKAIKVVVSIDAGDM